MSDFDLSLGLRLRPATLDDIRFNAQQYANLDQVTYYIFEDQAAPDGFGKWLFTEHDDYDTRHDDMKFIEAVDPNP